MTRPVILRNLFYCLIISVIAVIFYWVTYTPLSGCFKMTNKEKALMALFNIGTCLLIFTCSLTALRVVNPSIRRSFIKTFLAFMGPSLCLFILSIFGFVIDGSDRKDFMDFFIIGAPTTSFFAALFCYYLKFIFTNK